MILKTLCLGRKAKNEIHTTILFTYRNACTKNTRFVNTYKQNNVKRTIVYEGAKNGMMLGD